MPNLLHTQNQYFKFEKDNKNNVIKKTNSQGLRRAATNVSTANSKTKNALPVTISNTNAANLLKRNVYQPPIRNVQRDYSVAAPRVQTRLTPMTTLAAAAGKPPLTHAVNAAVPKRSRTHSRDEDISTNSTSPHGSPIKKTRARTLSPNCKQRLARLQKATMQRKNSAIENVFSAFAPYENKDLANTARSLTQTPLRGKSCTSTTSKSRSQSTSPQRSCKERQLPRISFRQKPAPSTPPAPQPSNSTSQNSLEKQAFALKASTKRLDCTLRTPPPTPYSIFDSNLMVHSMEKILSNCNVQLNTAELELLQRVVGADQRAPCLRTSDTRLFKEILRTQLQQIEAQEVVIKRSLIKLENTQAADFMNVMRQLGITDPSLSPEEALIPALPLLEKEVKLLQTLGERLEAKLDLHEKRQVEMRSATTSVTNLRPIMKPILEFAIYKPERKWYSRLVNVYGVRCEFGYAQEFQVVKRSLLELKQHASDAFYIPAEADLKCITFAELQQQPEMILRYLKPKHAQGLQFNLLDHDPHYFKTFLETNELQEKCKVKWQEAHKMGFPVEDVQEKLRLGSPRRVVKDVVTHAMLSHRQVGGKCEVMPSEDEHRAVEYQANLQPNESRNPSETQSIKEDPNEEKTKNLMETLIALAVAEVDTKLGEAQVVATPKKKIKARKKQKQVKVKVLKLPTYEIKKLPQTATPIKNVSKTVSIRKSANRPMMKTILIGALQSLLCLLLIVAFTYPEISCTSL